MDSTNVRGMDAPDLYLSLLKGCLTRSLFMDEELRELKAGGWRGRVWDAFKHYTKHPDWRIVKPFAASAQRCGQAIRDYRAEHDITEPIREIDWTGVYWRRER